MHLIKQSFGFIWALWGAFWFMVVVIIFTPIYALLFALFGTKYSMACVWCNCHYLSPFLLGITGIRVKVFGKEKLDKNRTYVFVGNHLTQIDILATAVSVPRPIRFLAKIETKYIPVFGLMVKMLGIRVDRKNKESREKSYGYMAQALKRGECLFIYPEGTRNRTNELLKDFKDGAFRVAIMAQVPVAVQTLVGIKEVNAPEGIQLYPGKVEVHWSQPIETAGMTLDDVPRLREMVRQQMLKHLTGN
ncbi:MAG TPA: lysophospholipid acyltransferase family protein [Chitinophagales bacterium]|nr:lysophospholipid acyltransferase family protein [Chitinophagales bacterium]